MSDKIQQLSDMLNPVGKPDTESTTTEPLDQPLDPDAIQTEKAEETAADFCDGHNLEQPNDSRRGPTKRSQGEMPRSSAGVRESPRTSFMDGSARLSHALQVSMRALELSLSKATEVALRQSIAIAESVLEDHLSLPHGVQDRHDPHGQHGPTHGPRSQRVSASKHPAPHATRSSSVSHTTSMSSIGQEWSEMSARVPQLGAARRKSSVTNSLWTDI